MGEGGGGVRSDNRLFSPRLVVGSAGGVFLEIRCAARTVSKTLFIFIHTISFIQFIHSYNFIIIRINSINSIFVHAKATLSYERYISVPKGMWFSWICIFSRLSVKLFRMICKRYFFCLFCFVALYNFVRVYVFARHGLESFDSGQIAQPRPFRSSLPNVRGGSIFGSFIRDAYGVGVGAEHFDFESLQLTDRFVMICDTLCLLTWWLNAICALIL